MESTVKTIKRLDSVALAELIADFNFNKVMKVIEVLDLKYRGETPTIHDVMQVALLQLQRALEKGRESSDNCYDTSTGGFTATYSIVDNKERLTLTYTVESKRTF
jgi:hypothetical protein